MECKSIKQLINKKIKTERKDKTKKHKHQLVPGILHGEVSAVRCCGRTRLTVGLLRALDVPYREESEPSAASHASG